MSGEPPWGGWGEKFRPELIPAVDPAKFQRVVFASIPRQWPKPYPKYWPAPMLEGFREGLKTIVGQDHLRWTPIYQRFMALLTLLEEGGLGPGWPSQKEFFSEDEQVKVKIHPALMHTAAQLTLQPDGFFSPEEFRRTAIAAAKRMGLALPAGLAD